MAASVNDKITDTRNAARPNSARVSSSRAVGATTLACDNLAGWPTASKVHFVTYTIDTNSNPVAGTQLDCSGIVSGNNIGSLSIIDGTDNGNVDNDVVEMLPTAKWGQDLSDALMQEHSRTGTHAAITATSINNAGTLTQTGLGTFNAGLTVASGTLTASGALSGITPDKMSNPYKFSVYRNAAFNAGNNAFALVTFDTKLFDTGSNYSISTGLFTAPVAGFYQLSSLITSSHASARWIINLTKNGSSTEIARGGDYQFSATTVSSTFSGLFQLSANDTVQINLFSDTTNSAATGQSVSWFSGYIVSAT